MKEDYNFAAFIHEGFEQGLLYVLRYVEEEYDQVLSVEDITRLAAHLESKKKWNNASEWEQLIHGYLR